MAFFSLLLINMMMKRIIKTTSWAGGMHKPYKVIIPAAPSGALNDSPGASTSRSTAKAA